MKRGILYFSIFIAGLLILTTKKLIRDATGLGVEWGWISVLAMAIAGLIIFALKYHKDVDSDLEVDGNEAQGDGKGQNDSEIINQQTTKQGGDSDV